MTRMVHSSGFAWIGHRLFRSVENYTADGEVDISRSHYSINRRSVTRKRFSREFDAPCVPVVTVGPKP